MLLAKMLKKKRRGGGIKGRQAIFTEVKKIFFEWHETVYQGANWAKTWKHKLYKPHKIIGWRRAEKQCVELNISKLKVGIFGYHALQASVVWQVHWRWIGNLCPVPKSKNVPPSLGSCINCSVVCEKAISRNDENIQMRKLHKSRVMNKCMSYKR